MFHVWLMLMLTVYALIVCGVVIYSTAWGNTDRI